MKRSNVYLTFLKGALGRMRIDLFDGIALLRGDFHPMSRSPQCRKMGK